MKGILKRLEELEAYYKREPLLVVARTATGDTLTVTARECLERGLEFVRIAAGNSLKDLDSLLQAMYRTAEDERRTKKG